MRRAIRVTFCLTVLSAVVAGCGSSSGSSGSSSSSSTSGSSTAASSVSACMKTATATAAAKTYTQPPTAANPAAKGKTIAIVAVGLSSPTVAVGTQYVEAAAKAMGWKYTVYDGKLDPANFPVGIQQAIAAKVSGIVGIGLDAPTVTAAAKQAAAAGIPIVSVQGWDLNDVPGSSSAQPVYTVHISFGSRYKSFADAMIAYGATSAAWDIEKAGCTGKIIDFSNDEYVTLELMQEGFVNEVKQVCPKCTLVDVPWLAADFGPQLTALANTAFLKNPTAVAANGATNPTLGITQAVVQSHLVGKIQMIGGFGVAADYDTLRSNTGINAVNSWPLEWWSYAAVDTLNSYFNKTPARDEGLGFQIIDQATGLPAPGQNFAPPFDVAAAYAKSWGVGS